MNKPKMFQHFGVYWCYFDSSNGLFFGSGLTMQSAWESMWSSHEKSIIAK